jgi:hypothetical protein
VLARSGAGGLCRRRPAAAALAVIAVALAGCGGSSSSRPTTTRAAASPASNTTTDRQVARNAQLRLTDFPAGWLQSATAQATSRSPCQSVEGAKAATSARGTSHDFSNRRDVPAAYSAVYVYADASTAGRWFDELSSTATGKCLARVLAKALPSAGNEEITTRRVAIKAVGDQRAEARLTIPVSADGSSRDLNADLVFVRVNRAVAILTLLDTVGRFDQTLATGLTRAVADRLSARLR